MNKNEKPLVSIIVPAYNHEAWVKEAILSVVNQTYGYENIQLIVTDDCSKDNTPVILKELADKYGFELFLHQQNVGVCSTLNEMISLSKGKYIAGMASDDIMFLDRIEKQINILNKHPDIDILAGSSVIIDRDGNTIYASENGHDSSLIPYTFEDFFLRLKPGFPAGSVIIKRELFQRIGAYDPNYKIEDLYFWLKATFHDAKVMKSNTPYLYYRLLNSSISSDNELMTHEAAKIFKIYKEHPKYSEALQNLTIRNLSKLLFNSKIKVIQHLIKNPVLLSDRKTLKIVLMLIVPKFILKQKFHENYFRHATQ